MLSALLLLMFAAPHAARIGDKPIITSASSARIGTNIDGPSLIKVPAWISHPLGKYYLYFANHKGVYIRLAYADQIQGPWKIYEPGTLQLDQVPACHDHIASPDVHIDEATRQIRMYFHCPAGGAGVDISIQKSLVAFSADGLHFKSSGTLLGPAYYRVFRWRDNYYAICWGGQLLKSKDGISPFDPGPDLVPADNGRTLRHAAVYMHGDTLSVFYSRIGDEPERILVSQVKLTGDWTKWKASPPQTVLQPERDYEGGSLPLRPSVIGDAPGRVRQLRDPCIFEDDGHLYLLYSVAGESGIALAELK